MNREEIETAVGLAGKSIALIGGIVAFIVAIIPRFRRAVGAYCTAHDLSEKFGPEAGKTIHRMLVSNDRDIATMRAMIDATHRAVDLGVYVCDSTGKCIQVNSVLEHWFGLSNEECKDYGWLGAIVDREEAHRNWSFAIKNETPYRDVYEIRNAVTGATFKAETQSARIKIDGGQLHVGFVRKI